jgi:hypothetical protein
MTLDYPGLKLLTLKSRVIAVIPRLEKRVLLQDSPGLPRHKAFEVKIPSNRSNPEAKKGLAS